MNAGANPEMLILAREVRGLTQAALAELLGTTQATVCATSPVSLTCRMITSRTRKGGRAPGFFLLLARPPLLLQLPVPQEAVENLGARPQNGPRARQSSPHASGTIAVSGGYS